MAAAAVGPIPLVRERLRELIEREPDLAVCGEAADHQPALLLANTTQPDLVLVDLTLRESHGLDLLKDLHIRHPEIPVLVLSMHDESLYAERAIRAGARGYITKQEATKSVLKAIDEIGYKGWIGEYEYRPHTERACTRWACHVPHINHGHCFPVQE